MVATIAFCIRASVTDSIAGCAQPPYLCVAVHHHDCRGLGEIGWDYGSTDEEWIAEGYRRLLVQEDGLFQGAFARWEAVGDSNQDYEMWAYFRLDQLSQDNVANLIVKSCVEAVERIATRAQRSCKR